MAEESQTEDRFPRVTQAQLQLWLADPTTKKYFQCLEWTAVNCTTELGLGEFIDADDPTKTLSAALTISVTRAAVYQSCRPTQVLNHYNMLEIPSEEESDVED